LLLLAWLHWGTQFPLRVESEVWLELGLATACGAALALLAVERAIRPLDQHERLMVELAIGLGNLELALLKRGRRGTRAAASAAWVAIFPCLAVLYGGLPPLQAVPLLGFAWAIQQATLILHELGHALCGLALGYRVRRLVVGGAPKLATFNVGSASVELGLRPSHGLVEFDFGAVPVWVGLRRVAWAGPATGLIPLAAGIVGEVVYIRSRFAFFVFSLLIVYGLSSCAQLKDHGLALVGERTRSASNDDQTMTIDGARGFRPKPRTSRHTGECGQRLAGPAAAGPATAAFSRAGSSICCETASRRRSAARGSASVPK
jgi:Peptidase family M50